MTSRAGHPVLAARRAPRSCERRTVRGSRRRATRVSHDYGKPDTSMNREKPERIVEAYQGFEIAAVDEAMP